jgi:hypothetical protein
MKKLRTLTLAFSALAMTISMAACQKEPVAQMTVTTKEVTEIGPTSAKFNGTINDHDGRTLMSLGFVYSSQHSPTAADSAVYGGNNGDDIFAFVGSLTPNTTYRVRAMLTDSDFGTIIGGERYFTTLP